VGSIARVRNPTRTAGAGQRGVITAEVQHIRRNTLHQLHQEITVSRKYGSFTLEECFAKLVTGGLVAGTGAGLLLNTWPRIGSWWVPPTHVLWSDWHSPMILNLVENQVLIQFIHRWWAFAAAAAVIVFVARTLPKALTTRGRIALRAVTTILVLQILLGIGNLLMKVPFWMAFAHLATGLALYVTLLVITHEVKFDGEAEAV
jgi:cytochrome c oxidase assembly protein subunit 15